MAKLWADFTDAEKAAYFNRYGEDAVWPIGYTTAVANGLPQTYIVRNQDSDADAFQLFVKTTNREMSTITVDPAPDATTGLYAANTPVTVSIALRPGASFVRWEGPVAEEDRTQTTIVVPMAAQKKLTAVVKVQPVIVDGSFAVSFPRGDSQAQAVFRLSGEEGAVYDATAEILWKTNGTDWAVCRTLTGLANGQTVSAWLPAPFLAGSTLDVRVRVSAVGADEVSDEVDGVAVTNPLPANFGLGGGEGIFHVRADATGNGSGTDWFNAALRMPTSQSKLPAGTKEVWFAGDASACIDGTAEHAVPGPLAMRGGFLGVECRPEERPADARSLVDREDTVNYGFSTERGQYVFNVSQKVTLDGFCFRRAKVTGVFAHVGGNGLFELVNCTFESNCVASGMNYNNGGRVLNVYGYAENNTWGAFACSNCVFRDNGLVGADAQKAAVLLSTLKGVEVADCSFVNNGLDWDKPILGSAPSWLAGGVALFVNNSPLSMNRCEFRANRGLSGSDSDVYPQGIVEVQSTLAKTVWACGITNCLFVGNQYTTQGNAHGCKQTGALSIRDSTTLAHPPPEVVNCTIAYNMASEDSGAAGLSVKYGTVKVRNSIIYGNRTMPSAVGGSDIFVTQSGAAVDLDYSLVTSLEKANVWAVSGATLTLGDNVKTGDPKFVTTLDDFNALVLVTNDTRNAASLAFAPTDESLAAVKAFDVHVTTGTSPAVDAGDPSSPYQDEPLPNGGCINLGVYGNTKEAHVTEIAQPTVGDVTIEFPYGTTQPKVSFALGGDADYSATATLYWSTNGSDFVECGSWTSLNRGDAISEILSIAFKQYAMLTMKVKVTAYGATDVVSATEPTELLNPMPESYGKGGGDGVFHLRPDATGDGSGRDWFNAVTNVYDIYQGLVNGAREVWIAGSNVLTKTSETLQPTVPLTIRGGFVGTECSADARRKDAKSVLDGNDTYVPLTVKNTAAAVEVERLVLCHASANGLKKTGGADISVHDCDFVANSREGRASYMGSGASLSGTAGSTEMSVSNCTFVGNQFFSGGNDGRYYPSGLGLYVESAKRVTVDDALFLTNGTPLDVDSRGYGQGLRGAAFCAINAPVTMRRCAFRANRGAGYCSWGGDPSNETYLQGGTVILKGACGGSAFTNCLWAGNASDPSVAARTADRDKNSVCQGAMVVFMSDPAATVDFANCTFADNLIDAVKSPSALNVFKGTAHVTHSIFAGNVIGTYAEEGLGRDVAVSANGTLSVDWTLFDHPLAESVSVADGGTLKLDEKTVTNAPAQLVTAPETIASIVVTNSGSWNAVRYTFIKFNPTRATDVLPSANVHLRGGSGYVDERTGEKVTRYRRPRSPAIDAGDPRRAWVNEPVPNGRRVNLGAYGNTVWATGSAEGSMLSIR